ncbi:MAG: hypothetical protein H0V01_10180 [Bacteroidetes bacterium]|nr:hypothetical protein [Bacteroidota bacterium]HET6246028.1 hypothetical protein [Bacteroidia bacterium]
MIVSCEKEKTDTEVETAKDHAVVEMNFISIFSTIHSLGIQENGFKKTEAIKNICASIESFGDTLNFPNSGPIRVDIDYGNSGCTGSDSRPIRGKLMVTFNDKWSKQGAITNVELEQYFVNGINLNAAIIITNTGNNTYRFSVTNAKCTASTWSVKYNSSLEIKQSEGAGTKSIISDDVFEITGSADGISRINKTYVSNIAFPVILRSSCKWLESGICEITPQDAGKRSLNYGHGNCDNEAVISINGDIYQIELK